MIRRLRAAELGRPVAAVGRAMPVEELSQALGTELPGQPGAAASPAVVTLGPAVEDEVRRLMRSGRLTRAHALDQAGNLLLAQATRELCRDLSGAWLSPGCHGLPLTLIPMIADLAGAREVEVEVLPSGMLRPEKSVAGFILHGVTQPLVCLGCASPICPWSAAGDG